MTRGDSWILYLGIGLPQILTHMVDPNEREETPESDSEPEQHTDSGTSEYESDSECGK